MGDSAENPQKLRRLFNETHKLDRATLHERSEGNRAPKGASRRISRPVVTTSQRLVPSPLPDFPRNTPFLFPRIAASSTAKHFASPPRACAKHDLNHRLANHTGGRRATCRFEIGSSVDRGRTLATALKMFLHHSRCFVAFSNGVHGIDDVVYRFSFVLG